MDRAEERYVVEVEGVDFILIVCGLAHMLISGGGALPIGVGPSVLVEGWRFFCLGDFLTDSLRPWGLLGNGLGGVGCPCIGEGAQVAGGGGP